MIVAIFGEVLGGDVFEPGLIFLVADPEGGRFRGCLDEVAEERFCVVEFLDVPVFQCKEQQRKRLVVETSAGQSVGNLPTTYN